MRCEWPVLRRCCLCIPLRFGLLGFGYVKMALDLLFLTLILASLRTFRMNSRDVVTYLVAYSISITLLVVDVVLNILFIYGSHKKDPAKLRVFYRYSLVMLVLSILWALALVAFNVEIFINSPYYVVSSFIIIYMSTWILGIIIQVYVIILVINEVKKLETYGQFQFTNDKNGAATADDQPPTTVELK